MNLLLAAVATVAFAVFMARRAEARAPSPDMASLEDGYDEPTQETTLFEDVIVNLDPSTYTAAAVPPDVASQNTQAFLDMIAYSEGTAGPDGYRTLFGGGLFDSYADHPRIVIAASGYRSSAAGRYQILQRTWDGLRGKLGLADFSPASQDAAAIELIRERGALGDVEAGNTKTAITKVAKVWASLPGAGYNQPERKLSQLLAAYSDAGGLIREV